MSREQRVKYAGMLFFLLVATSLVFTPEGSVYVKQQVIDKSSGSYAAIIAAIVALFTSESMGFIFHSLHVLFWNAGWRKCRIKLLHWIWIPAEIHRLEHSGFAKEWEKLHYHLNEKLLDALKSRGASTESYEEYGEDVFLSYWWQQAPRVLVEWVSRRHSTFFAGMASVWASAFATLFSFSMMVYTGWQPGVASFTVFLIGVLLGLVHWRNAFGERMEALHMIDLWLLQGFDDNAKAAFDEITARLSFEEAGSGARSGPAT